MPFILFLLAIVAGLANPFQSGVNAELNKQLTRPLWTGLIVYGSGLAGLMLVQLFVREPLPGARLVTTPWWAWTGGLISLISTVVGLTIAQRLGSGLFTGLSVTASLVTSVALDHFGLIGFRQHHASPARIAGCALMIAGVWLIARF
jgi:transporter family-2 protein